MAKPLGISVVAHIGANSITDVLEMARYCTTAGVDAIAVNPPTFFKPAGARGAAEWLKVVGAAAPSLPLYYYHFPLVTGAARCRRASSRPASVLARPSHRRLRREPAQPHARGGGHRRAHFPGLQVHGCGRAHARTQNRSPHRVDPALPQSTMSRSTAYASATAGGATTSCMAATTRCSGVRACARACLASCAS